ncbi:hypothetical protein E9232_003568 [Inquilinus ginsengisoli]|uniref:Uncharacterized protein n=1 Tax=Inquilinus ginsengisoli TaxID=363840 RepID=A0ABU1JRW2_9PROT|nr:hypothetical protein [Inquilinus ginsengisoli]MDR6291042.1 hypothetical protein [Inquilinus ginsengisoli]
MAIFVSLGPVSRRQRDSGAPPPVEAAADPIEVDTVDQDQSIDAAGHKAAVASARIARVFMPVS